MIVPMSIKINIVSAGVLISIKHNRHFGVIEGGINNNDQLH